MDVEVSNVDILKSSQLNKSVACIPIISNMIVYVSAIELIKELMEYEVQLALLRGLVRLLRPAKEDLLPRPELLDGNTGLELQYNLLVLLWTF